MQISVWVHEQIFVNAKSNESFNIARTKFYASYIGGEHVRTKHNMILMQMCLTEFFLREKKLFGEREDFQ